MPQSFGNPGGKPRPPGRQPPGGSPLRGSNFQNRQPSFRQSNEEDEVNVPSIAPVGSTRGAQSQQQETEIQKIEPGKRVVALIFDCVACYMVGLVLTVIPFLAHFVTLSTTWILMLLVKDWLFDGRGIGKNAMGLQVIDIHTGRPCSLKQSIIRNFVILAPFAVLQVISVLLAIVPIGWLSAAVKNIINAVGMVYVGGVLPYECYRAYTRDDSRRLGDELAGTALVESSMDFSNPFSK
ncbi:MAG TPA: RDD family protein [Planktothrix sp.]